MQRLGDIAQLPLPAPAPVQRKPHTDDHDEQEQIRAIRWDYFYPRLVELWDAETYGYLTKRRFAIKTAHLTKLTDWYYLQSVCRDARNRGVLLSVAFWGALKPR